MLTTILIVLGVLVLVLALGGALVLRRRAARDVTFAADLDAVNQALAAAHAQDKGWEPAALDAAARQAFAAERPAAQIDELTLVAVEDLPGTDSDRAVFRVRAGAEDAQLTLGRSDGQWRLESLR